MISGNLKRTSEINNNVPQKDSKMQVNLYGDSAHNIVCVNTGALYIAALISMGEPPSIFSTGLILRFFDRKTSYNIVYLLALPLDRSQDFVICSRLYSPLNQRGFLGK